MQLVINSTDQFAFVDDTLCRVWKGLSAAGVEAVCLIAAVGAREEADREQFERELVEIAPNIITEEGGFDEPTQDGTEGGSDRPTSGNASSQGESEQTDLDVRTSECGREGQAQTEEKEKGSPLMNVGKLEFRAGGDFWTASYRLADDDVIELGRIRLTLVEDNEQMQTLFKVLMIEAMTQIIKTHSGKMPDWKIEEPKEG